jgi:hypothetical protein
MDTASQAGDEQQMHNEVPGPRTKTTSKTQTAREENPSQNLTKLLKTYQELICNTSAQRHTNQVAHLRQIPQGPCTGQTGQAWAARDE